MEYRKFADLSEELRKKMEDEIMEDMPVHLKSPGRITVGDLVTMIAHTVDKLIERGFKKNEHHEHKKGMKP